ncbi:hypothetical protein [Listeria booriae]|uniref:hypothetical protein n=1 Tax=Listeria booriae TaxID=1552123 RepID=UPI00162A5D69|nr:hypothetical protein [Listeria booriae]MBC2173988.1 hypothetical protein [Listeria booriae]
MMVKEMKVNVTETTAKLAKIKGMLESELQSSIDGKYTSAINALTSSKGEAADALRKMISEEQLAIQATTDVLIATAQFLTEAAESVRDTDTKLSQLYDGQVS